MKDVFRSSARFVRRLVKPSEKAAGNRNRAFNLVTHGDTLRRYADELSRYLLLVVRVYLSIRDSASGKAGKEELNVEKTQSSSMKDQTEKAMSNNLEIPVEIMYAVAAYLQELEQDHKVPGAEKIIKTMKGQGKNIEEVQIRRGAVD